MMIMARAYTKEMLEGRRVSCSKVEARCLPMNEANMFYKFR